MKTLKFLCKYSIVVGGMGSGFVLSNCYKREKLVEHPQSVSNNTLGGACLLLIQNAFWFPLTFT